jgi:hypothetical protein
MLCKYSEIFGKVAEGVHSYRIFNIAIVDVIMTVIGAFVLHFLYPKYSVLSFAIVLFLLGIILHRVFCVRTTIDRLLFDA